MAVLRRDPDCLHSAVAGRHLGNLDSIEGTPELDADRGRHPPAAEGPQGPARPGFGAVGCRRGFRAQRRRPVEEVRFAGRRRQGRLEGKGAYLAQPDRTQRRRQDDLLQHADRADAERGRNVDVPRPRHHRHARTPAHRCRSRAFLPDRQRIHQSDRVRDGTGGGASTLALPRLAMARRLPASRGLRTGLDAARHRWSCGSRPRALCESWPMANNACSKLRWRWRPSRSCCCWTNRWPDLATPTANGSPP